MFRDPLVADGAQIRKTITSPPGRDDGEDDSGKGQAYQDPDRIHEVSPFGSSVPVGPARHESPVRASLKCWCRKARTTRTLAGSVLMTGHYTRYESDPDPCPTAQDS